jgi:hypothetical protein
MNKAIMLATVAALGLGVAACDGGAENKAESQAQEVRESSEAAADKMEQGVTNDATEEKAEAVREAGDEKADKMEDAADKKDAGAPQ